MSRCILVVLILTVPISMAGRGNELRRRLQVTDGPSITPSFSRPTRTPTTVPTATAQTMSPTESNTSAPSMDPTLKPSVTASTSPSMDPTSSPSISPTDNPTKSPSPSTNPSSFPTRSVAPSVNPSNYPSAVPSTNPTKSPFPSAIPSSFPSTSPTVSHAPSSDPSSIPSLPPTLSRKPSLSPSSLPSVQPSDFPSLQPSQAPTVSCETRVNSYDWRGSWLYFLLVIGLTVFSVAPAFVRVLLVEKDYEKKSLLTENVIRTAGTATALSSALIPLLGSIEEDCTQENGTGPWIIVSLIGIESLIDLGAFSFGGPWLRGNWGYEQMRWYLNEDTCGGCCCILTWPIFSFASLLLTVGNNYDLRQEEGWSFFPTVFVLIMNILATLATGCACLGLEERTENAEEEGRDAGNADLRRLWVLTKVVNGDISGMIIGAYTDPLVLLPWCVEFGLDVGMIAYEHCFLEEGEFTVHV